MPGKEEIESERRATVDWSDGTIRAERRHPLTCRNLGRLRVGGTQERGREVNHRGGRRKSGSEVANGHCSPMDAIRGKWGKWNAREGRDRVGGTSTR